MYSLQLDLFQHIYASVHEYALSQGLTNTDSVVEDCTQLYEPVRQRAETEIKSLREGKIAKIPVGGTAGMAKPGLFARKSSIGASAIGLGKSKPPPPPPPPAAAPPAYSTQDTAVRPSNKASGSYKSPPPPPSSSSPKPASPATLSPNLGRQSSYGLQSAVRTPSPSSISSSSTGTNGKKKPPPPPVAPKPSVSPKPEFVVAKYDFGGENEGDLPFKTGDRIKIVHKTESMEDWWEGECNGLRGMFPRNYCE